MLVRFVTTPRLTVHDHDRRRGGRTYVYPVVSRRARGVSVGVNLNPNAACNWRCAYCQVPDLVRGAGPVIDLSRLATELGDLLDEIAAPGWMEAHAPADARRLNDVAFSGDGEPTSSPQFPDAVEAVHAALDARGLSATVKRVLITNGSLVHQPRVQDGLRRLARAPAEVWFKMDAGTDAGLRRMNDTHTTIARQRDNLALAARLAPTWVQTMVLDRGGPSLDGAELDAYVALLRGVVADGAPLRGVLLYGLARPPLQPEGATLQPLPAALLARIADAVHRGTGLPVSLHG